MSINRITSPLKPPASDDDWSNTQAIIDALALGIEGPLRVVGTNIVRGSVFNIGGSVYVAVADTAITGTASKYVKLTPSGSSASASFVASLSGVTWNSTYNGYYDGSNNLYIFDELQAYASGVISAIRSTRQGNYATQDRLGIGNGCKAGLNATAVGYNNTASGNRSSAVGYNNTASGNRSSAVGYGCVASGDSSFAAGIMQYCDTSGEAAINNIRYVRFPAGTTEATIFTKLYGLFGNNPTWRKVGAIGSYGVNGSINYIEVYSVDEIIIHYETLFPAAVDSFTLFRGDASTISSTLRLLFISGVEG